MPVIGLTIRNISAKRLEDYNGPFSIAHRTAIKEVSEINLETIGKKALKLRFEFGTDYLTEQKKKFAAIELSGDVLFLAESPAEVLLKWKKEKKLPEEINLEAINAVIRKCLTRAIALSEDINLPPPLPIPYAKKGA